MTELVEAVKILKLNLMILNMNGDCIDGKANDPDSADSQFFICYDSHPFLDGKYTVWGKVIEGMNLIDRIPEEKGQNGQVLRNPTKIITIRLK